MTRRNISILILVILLVLTLGFIWGNSMLGAETSAKISSTVKEFFEKIAEILFPGQSVLSEDSGDNLIRKLAHFTEFLALGAELTLLLCRMYKKSTALPLFCGLMAALFDETIQLFSDGRGSRVSDVWIDFAGVLTGFLIVTLFAFCYQRRKRRKQKL